MEIKSFQIKSFRAYNSSTFSNADEFGKINLVYGWNGSGKTTFSSLCQILENDYQTQEDFEFKIKYSKNNSDNTLLITNKNYEKEKENFSVKVFNRQFIDDHLGYNTSSKFKHVVFLGKESKDLTEKLSNNQEKEKVTQKELDDIKTKNKSISDEKTKWTKECVQEYIAFNKVLGCFIDSNSFKSSHLIKKFNDISKDDILKSDIKDNLLKILKQKQCNLIEIHNFVVDISIIQKIKILDKIIKPSLIIERLQSDNILNDWVYNGYKNFKNYENCPYCNKKLDIDFNDNLDKYFNNEIESYIEELTSLQQLLKSLDDIINKIKENVIYETNICNELKEEYHIKELEFQTKVNNLSKEICKLQKVIKQKIQNPFSKPEYNLNETVFFLSTEDIDKIIETHNAKMSSLTINQTVAKTKLQNDFLACKKEKYNQLETDLNKNNLKLEGKTKELNDIKDEILELQKSIKDFIKPCDEINDYLKEYWGNTNLQLVPVEDGYVVKRKNELDKNVKNLSEGEKTAIAFCYFVKSLEDKSFDKNNSIIVVDDPVSSMDSNSLFTTFAFVTRKLTSLGQLFILTHNFLFFKEMKTWSVYQKNVKYFYTKRSENFLLFENMPNSLKNRSSDYLYLFETVYKMSTKDKLTDDEIESCANFARRLLEGFVKFKNLKNTNNGSSFFNKFRELQAITIDEVKKARIYRFVNMFSHDDESFALYPEIDYTALIANAQEIIKDLLKFIEEIDKFHYDSAISAIS